MTPDGITFNPTKILVPTDFSPSAEVALETAIDLAQHYRAKLYLLHVIPMFPSFGEGPIGFHPEREFLEERQKRAEDSLLASVMAIDKKGLQARSCVEVGDDVVGNVLAVIEREQADLLVISTHGLSGWRPMIFGSTAEKVVTLAECPILLLRSIKPNAEHKATKS